MGSPSLARARFLLSRQNYSPRVYTIRLSFQARRRESLVQSTEERLQIATHDLLFRIHYAVQVEATLATAAKRNIIAPCSWYFELLDTFQRSVHVWVTFFWARLTI